VLLAVSERNEHLKFGGSQGGRWLYHSPNDISSMEIVKDALHLIGKDVEAAIENQ
jgi:hypothetical protein